MNMNKRNVVIIVAFVAIIALGGVLLFISKDKEVDNTINNDVNIVYDISRQGELIETIEDTTIQGVVEMNRNGYIYAFNGQHFGEFGFEMGEYTSTNIDNKNQECIDYFTLEKYDTNYIQEGDIIICKGDLKKYYMRHCDLDTKDNPIIVLKADDYNKMKKETLSGKRETTITVGEYFDNNGEIYIKYEMLDKEYKLPFVLKFTITDDTEIKGSLGIGKKLKIQYKDLNVSIDELKLKTIEVIEE